MALDTFFVEVYKPKTINLLRTKMDRISFVDPMDHPILDGLKTYFKYCLEFEYTQDNRSRNEIMPLHDSFVRLDSRDVTMLREIVDSLVSKHSDTYQQIFHFLKDYTKVLDGLIQDRGEVYANEAIRLVFQELAELGVLG